MKRPDWEVTMMSRTLASVALAASVLVAAGAASAATVTVQATAGPWDPSVTGNNSYGVGDQTAATSVKVNPGDDIVIHYLSGLTSGFGGVGPSVDALGYQGGVFGSGLVCALGQCTGIGSSGQPIPSYYIDPTNTGPQIALMALIGVFVDSSGKVLSEFAPGDGPYSVVAPTGAVALQLGFNDDIYTYDNGKLQQIDNTGALSIGVTGSTAMPEPATWAMLMLGLAMVGFAARRAKAGAAVAA
jgi:hypothetical protein